MSTRYAREITAQNSANQLTANGRDFVVSHHPRGLAEIVSRAEGCLSSFPGYWRGQPRRGFQQLEAAGAMRRLAAAQPRHRATWIRRAREALRRSAELRLSQD